MAVGPLFHAQGCHRGAPVLLRTATCAYGVGLLYASRPPSLSFEAGHPLPLLPVSSTSHRRDLRRPSQSPVTAHHWSNLSEPAIPTVGEDDTVHKTKLW